METRRPRRVFEGRTRRGRRVSNPRPEPQHHSQPETSGLELPFGPGCASVASVPSSDPNDCIRLRGVRQNNLKGFDLDLPLGSYIVVTGLSGAGKSSLVFDTLHAEGQRRYVETFSAYTRQFLDLLPKPRVGSIENIRPSIAIQQTNTVKTSRSTVGTMTEITDFFKVWFSHVAECFDPETGEKVEDDQPASIWRKASSALSPATVVVAFKVAKPDNLTWPEILKNLKAQSYVRVLAPSPGGMGDLPAVTSGEGGVLPMSDGLTQAHGQDARATTDIQTPSSSGKCALLAHRIDDLLGDPALLARPLASCRPRPDQSDGGPEIALPRSGGCCPPLRSRRGSHLL